ncbi:MAG: type II secretion system F family protein [Caloramator sp.]|nr:type II secretion system F family protein [Caloramator sp.]
MFFQIFYLIKFIFIRLNRKIDEASCKKFISKEKLKNFEKYIYSNEERKKILLNTQNKLNILGNPLKLTSIKFYAIKIALALFFFLLSCFAKRPFYISLLIIIIAFFLIDIIYYFSNLDDNKKILYDLPDICDILNVQTSAGVGLGTALCEVYDIPKCKRLKNALIELAAQINITKNPADAMDRFVSKFNLIELKSFAFSIKQALQTGKSKDILNKQSDILKANNIFRIQERTKKIDSQLALIAVIIFFGVILFVVYSFSIQLNENLINIFK